MRPSDLAMAVWISTAFFVAACGAAHPPGTTVRSIREVGIVPNPPGCGGRDVGFSALFAGHSVWVFGDTFFADAAADGYHWRASTWSYADNLDASNGLDGWIHALGTDGKPRQLIPHTAEEQNFDDAHNGNVCAASSDCGARHTAWPGAWVVDPRSGAAFIFYSKEFTEPTGSFAFTAQGTSIATWPSPDAPAIRPAVRPDLPDSTVLFPLPEPALGAAALIDGDELYAYVCDGRKSGSPCIIARAPTTAVLERSAWQFWDGKRWVSDWRAASSIFNGAPLMSVHLNEHLNLYVAFYLVPLGSDMALRTAARPEGPWSDALRFGKAQTALDGSWDYGLAAHHELARDGGQIEYLSYFQPGRFLDGVIHLLEVSFP